MFRLANCLKGLAAVAAAALLVFPAAAAEPKQPNLDSAYREAAPKILKELRERKYDNVGVLKFLVAVGDGEPRGNVGSLNRTLADRLEVALTLLLDDNDKLGIIARASDAAASNPRANHLDPDGRAELFKIRPNKFSVPWKPNMPIKPDAFLTGVARVSPDLRTIDIKVQLFDNKELKELTTIAEFKAANDTRTLTESGVTFSRRGGAEPSDDLLAMVDPAAPAGGDKDNRADLAKAALEKLNSSPVQLEILYGGESQAPVADVGDKKTNIFLRVATPKENTKATFRLTNTSKKYTYGVVLRVNGLSTIFKEQQDPLSCYKWILKPGERVTVAGFQSDLEGAKPFIVSAPTRDELTSFSYQDKIGTIDLILFRGLPKPETINVQADPEKADQEMVAQAIGRGVMVLRKEPPATDLKAFKAQLKREGTETTSAGREGGIFKEGDDTEKNYVKKVPFYPSSLPELSATIRYYSLSK